MDKINSEELFEKCPELKKYVRKVQGNIIELEGAPQRVVKQCYDNLKGANASFHTHHEISTNKLIDEIVL